MLKSFRHICQRVQDYYLRAVVVLILSEAFEDDKNYLSEGMSYLRG